MKTNQSGLGQEWVEAKPIQFIGEPEISFEELKAQIEATNALIAARENGTPDTGQAALVYAGISLALAIGLGALLRKSGVRLSKTEARLAGGLVWLAVLVALMGTGYREPLVAMMAVLAGIYFALSPFLILIAYSVGKEKGMRIKEGGDDR